MRDEIWQEGGRRGRPVASEDPDVRARLCEAALRAGAALRIRMAAAGRESDAFTDS